MKKWIKIWPEKIFYGTTFQELDVAERGIWFSLMVMAAMGLDEGIVEMRKGVAYPFDMLAQLINCNKKFFRETLAKLEKVKKIEILEDGRIKILNWDLYQSRYEKYYKDKIQKKT